MNKFIYIFALSALLLVISLMYIRNIYANKPSEEQIQDYINNSTKHIITSTQFVSKNNKVYSHPFGFYTKVKRKRVCIVKSENFDKYYALESYTNGLGMLKSSVQGKDVIMIINNEDYSNPHYGSLKNPIPVLKYYINENFKDEFVSEAEYNYAIKEYMSFCR